ncbi:hypothetical protein GALL_417110 [mine drainage metagenome]|uniref:MSHA biogenesis protein MshK n=1 Tax=mine drainage metagenome TaxID=410659 RepID=A0A1J5Q9N8_9ZZZZ
MAEFMKTVRFILPLQMTVLAVAAIIASMGCLADTAGLVDPTQPPMGMVPAGAAGTGAGIGAVPAGPVLQSVMTGPGREIAIISGQSVRVGGKFGDATLVRVRDQEAILRARDGTLQVLSLHPAVKKKVTVQPQEDAVFTHKKARPVQPAAPEIR